jgi:hypothetical protein
VGQDAAKAQQRWVLVYRAPDRVGDLGQPPLLASQHEQRDPLRDDGPGRGPPADHTGLVDEALGVLETALHQREHGSVRADLPALCGLAELVGERVEHVELDV